MNKLSLLSKTIGSWDIVKGNVFSDLKKIESTINNFPDIPTHHDVRSTSIHTSQAPTIDTGAVDFFVIDQLDVNILSMSMNLMGTAVEGQTLTIRIFDDGTPRSITWGPKYASNGATLPTTTIPGAYLYIYLVYNAISQVWDCNEVNTGTPPVTVTPAALTKTDDTNVTATLTGTPATALLKAVNIALGWTGLLGLARGGTNANLSATGGAHQFLKQSSAGAAVTVGQPASSDLSDASNIPLLNAANTFSVTGNNFPDVTTSKVYFNSGMALEAVDLGTVANLAVNSLSIDGITNVDALLFISTQGTGGFHLTSQVVLRGSDHSTLIVSDPGTILSTVSGTGGRVNVYWSGSQYEIENHSTISLRIGLTYLMLRN